MVEQIILVLTLQIIFLAFYYRFGFRVASIIGRRVCPVCFAVGSTWVSLLTIRYTGVFQINKFLIAFLLAESVVGIANLSEEFVIVRQVKVSEPLLKFGIIIFGTLAVSIFAFVWEFLGLALFAGVVIFGILALTPVQKAEKLKEQESLALESKLKKCC